jgi:HAMP domain-containing protein
MKSFRAKLVIYIIPVLFLFSFFFLVFYLERTNNLLEKDLVEKGTLLSRDLAHASEIGLLSRDEILFKSLLEDMIGEEKDTTHIGVYFEDGEPFVFENKIKVGNALPEGVLEEMTDKKISFYKKFYTDERERVYDFYFPIFAISIGEQKNFIGITRVGLSLERLDSEKAAIISVGVAITLLITILMFFILLLLSKEITKPVKELTKGSEIISEGNLEYNIEVETKDEFGRLASSFNQMAGSLKKRDEELKNFNKYLESQVKERTKDLEEAKEVLEIKVKARTSELKELAENLDDKVKERTKELQRRVEELERFHRLTVGREMKMVELKKEKEELKKKLEAKEKGKKMKNK